MTSADGLRPARARASIATGARPVALLLTLAAACFGMPPPTALDMRLDFPGVEMLRPKWRRLVVDPELRPYDPVERSGAALDPGRGLVFVGTSQGRFLALDSGLGGEIWSHSETDPFNSAAVHLPEVDLVVVGNDGGHLLAFDPDDGRLAWRAALGAPIRRPVAYADRVAYARTTGGGVFAVEAETGRELWTFSGPAPEGYKAGMDAGLLSADGRIVTGFSDGTVVALSAVSGEKLWDINVAGEGDAEIVLDDITATPVRIEGAIVVASYDNGVFAVDAERGTQIWARTDLTRVSGLAAVGGDPLVALSGRGLARLDPADGSTVWIRRFPAGTLADPIVRDGIIVLSDDINGLLFFEALTGMVLQAWGAGHGTAGPPAVAGGRLAFLDNAGEFRTFYFLRRWFAAPR